MSRPEYFTWLNSSSTSALVSNTRWGHGFIVSGQLEANPMAERTWILYDRDATEVQAGLYRLGLEGQLTSINIPRSVTGIAFRHDDLPAVAEFFGFSEDSQISGTSRAGVGLLFPGERYSVKLETPTSAEQWSIVEDVIGAFARTIRRPVSVAACNGSIQRWPVDERKFSIRLWAAPETTRSRSYYGVRFWDRLLTGGQYDGVELDGSFGTPIESPEGNLVALLQPDALFIPFDLLHPNESWGADIILTPILDIAARMLIGEAGIESEVSRSREIARARFRKGYAELCTARAREQFDNAKTSLERVEARIVEYTAALIDQARQQKDLAATILRGSAVTPEMIVGYENDYERILAIDGVTKVETTGRHIRVYTDEVITDPLSDGTRRTLGKYIITITDSGDIRFENKSRRIDSRNHPHDMGRGTMCFGNVQEGFAKLVAAYEYVVLVEFLMDFLRRPNETESMGHQIFEWPVWKEGE